MKRVAKLVAWALAVSALIGSAGCARTPQDASLSTKPSPAPTGAAANASISAVVLAVPADLPPFSPRTIWIVSLDGRVSTRTIQPAPGKSSRTALSPDGRVLLYATSPGLGGKSVQPATALHALDLDTGRDSVILDHPPLDFGWDSSGWIVALTGVRSPFAVGSLAIWHGSPGSLSSAVPVATMPVDATSLLASDGRTAYFSGSTQLTNSMESPSIDHLWRYEFDNRRISLVRSTEQPGMPTDNLPPSLVRPPYTGAPPYSWQVPGIGLAYATFAPSGGGPRVRGVQLLAYSDLRPIRSIVPTPTGASEYFPSPVFDATFSHYLARTTGTRRGMPLPAKIVEVDVATNRTTVVDWPADPLARPIGYLGSTRSFLFMSGDTKGVAVVLQEPGKKPRVLVRLTGPYSTGGTWPGILGVQYSQ